MRVLWYPLGPWFVPSGANLEVRQLSLTMTDELLADATSRPYTYFFEPTPHPLVNNFDPIRMAARLAAISPRRPVRVVAFAGEPSPTPFETQCAFAAQVGHLLNTTPVIHRVSVKTGIQPRAKASKKGTLPGTRPRHIDPGPEVDWQRALAEAIGRSVSGQPISEITQKLVRLYLHGSRGEPGFTPTQKRLLHRASTGEISVIAEDVAAALYVQPGTATRAISGIATELFGYGNGRRSPEVVARVVVQYSWFLQYNAN